VCRAEAQLKLRCYARLPSRFSRPRSGWSPTRNCPAQCSCSRACR